ncbi:hypothetical protein DPMN_082568 [Dreissena polymorpha]|uniref:C1q domain-containing protein n=1 Tax=Dreissena polymorpha TaxID=45954 RepID=A0A9D3Y8C6_DREPO|nr:hypothetical protein DPMN_082568 [Dreissena polymorpha]
MQTLDLQRCAFKVRGRLQFPVLQLLYSECILSETLLRKGRASSVRPEVAFFASVSKDVQLGPGQVVVFNSVITNIDSTSHVLPYDG